LDLVLTDFGIASLSEGTLHLTNANRTASYSAPEALTGVVSKASDWWSVGVMVLELLKGVHPLAGMTEQVINFQLVSKGIVVPEELPADWGELLRGLLTRDHQKRWQGEQVRQWLAGRRNQATYYEAERKEAYRRKPYQFGGREYYTAKELAVALSRDWENGVRNLGRGFVSGWVERELGNQDLASRLLDLQEDAGLGPDEKLALALGELDPELPGIWKGNLVNRDWAAREPEVFKELVASKVSPKLRGKAGWPTELVRKLELLSAADLAPEQRQALERALLTGDPVLALGNWQLAPGSLSASPKAEVVALLEGALPEAYREVCGESWLAEAARRWRHAQEAKGELEWLWHWVCTGEPKLRNAEGGELQVRHLTEGMLQGRLPELWRKISGETWLAEAAQRWRQAQEAGDDRHWLWHWVFNSELVLRDASGVRLTPASITASVLEGSLPDLWQRISGERWLVEASGRWRQAQEVQEDRQWLWHWVRTGEMKLLNAHGGDLVPANVTPALLEGRLPRLWQQVSGETWLAQAAADWAHQWPQIASLGCGITKEQALPWVLCGRGDLQAKAQELLGRFVGATEPKLQALWAQGRWGIPEYVALCTAPPRLLRTQAGQLYELLAEQEDKDQSGSQETLRQLRELAEQGDADAQKNLGVCYHDGQGVAQDYAEAVKWFRMAAEQGNAAAQNWLGFCHQNGQGVAQDCAEAVNWFRMAAEQGNAAAQNWLGFCHQNGQGVAQDCAQAAKWFRMAAEQGHAAAQKWLGLCHQNGQGVAQDCAEAVKWFRLAAEQGHADAQNNLGFCHDNGQGVAQDYAEAVKWYRLAAEQGDADAQKNLGFCYDNGQGVAQDYAEAVKWFRLAADQGNADAQNWLGSCYYNGQGVAQDCAEAVKWFRLAADQGDADAQYNLGVCYYNGQGVVQDYAMAVKWFRMAAEQGHAAAQNWLGFCHQNSQGVAQDCAEAVKWFRLAADQGDADAQYNLGVCYYNGQGVLQDYAIAVKWYRLAAEQGHAAARTGLGSATKMVREWRRTVRRR
jgi:TPR repeat protein